MNDLNYFINYYKYSTLVYDDKCSVTEDVQFYESVNSKIWLINPNQTVIDIAVLEKLDNKKFFVHEVEGTWACIIQDKKTNEFRAIPSINNELPWYYSEKKPFVISNNIFLIVKLTGLTEPDELGIATFITFDHTFRGLTFLNGIKKVYGGDIIYMNPNSLNIVKDNLEKWLGFDDSIQDNKILVQQFVDEVDKSLRDPNPEITLTGGADSRIILAGGLLTKRKFKLMTGIPPTVDKQDIQIASKIAKELNIEHIKIDASKKPIDNIENVIERMAIETNSEFLPRNWIMFYKEYVLDESLNNRSKLLGYGGEIFKGFYSDLNGSFKKKTNILNHDAKDKVCDYAFHSYELYKKLNNVNSLNLFYQRERSHFWVPMNIRTNLSYCKCYSPLMGPKLLGMGYRIKGGIKNSGIHDQMLQTLPETIRNYRTNYSKLELIWFYIKRSYIKKYVNYELFLRPEFLKSRIDKELFKNIISPENLDNLLMQYESRGLNDAFLHKIFAVSNFFKILNN